MSEHFSKSSKESLNVQEFQSTGPQLLVQKKIDFPLIQSNRLLLNRMDDSDIDAVNFYASHPQTIKWVSWPAHQDKQHTFNFLQSIENCMDLTPNTAFITWALRLRENPSLAIGAINFSQFSEIAGQIDFVLSHEFWNRGLATEATRSLIVWIFLHYPKIRRIQAHCVEQHVASRRVMEKSGMQFEGIRRDGIKMKNQIYNLAIYSVLRSEAIAQ